MQLIIQTWSLPLQPAFRTSALFGSNRMQIDMAGRAVLLGRRYQPAPRVMPVQHLACRSTAPQQDDLCRAHCRFDDLAAYQAADRATWFEGVDKACGRALLGGQSWRYACLMQGIARGPDPPDRFSTLRIVAGSQRIRDLARQFATHERIAIACSFSTSARTLEIQRLIGGPTCHHRSSGVVIVIHRVLRCAAGRWRYQNGRDHRRLGRPS